MLGLINDPHELRKLIRRRRQLGIDHHDEVWDGVYIVSPQPNDEHQEIITDLSAALVFSIKRPGLGLVRAGINVSDREKGWTENYRCPDVAVYLNGTTARNLNTHWLGGPDFAVEVLSKGDRARKKFAFYAAVGTRELLLIDRRPWALELYRIDGGELRLVGKSTLESSNILASAVLALSFRLVDGASRPTILVAHSDGIQTWSA